VVLAPLTLDDSDLEAVRECRPGHCGLKLSSVEIRMLRSAAAAAGAEWKPALQTAFRDMVLARVRTYAVHGHSGLSIYADRKRPRSPGSAFAGLVGRTPFLAARAPSVAGHLLGSDEGDSGADGESYLYWSKERLGGKSVISATEVTIFRGDGATMPEVLMFGKQIFATHYLDACLGVTGLVRDRQTARSYLVYMHRSEVDLLGGFWGGIARHMIEERIAADGPGLLREAARRLSSGDPPGAQSRGGR
jgi:hypothetical protein